MKKILKKEVIIAFIIGLLIASGITVYATGYLANQVTYTREGTEIKSVEEALNDLYNKSNRTPQQVATLTTQGASYTFQNEGYITGTCAIGNNGGAYIYFNGTNQENTVFTVNWSDDTIYNCSIYAPKGTTVYTKSNYGTYNLTCYEFK